MIRKIVSGGQTGADRAALDWAMANGIPHGGWCPKGRLSEAGVIPDKYQLSETPTPSYTVRTAWNVWDSDGTLIVTLQPSLTEGSLATQQFAVTFGKPWLHINQTTPEIEAKVKKFLSSHSIEILNVAGSRESKEKGIYDFCYRVLDRSIDIERKADSFFQPPYYGLCPQSTFQPRSKTDLFSIFQDIIRLEKIQVDAWIGVPEEERRNKQKLLISVDLYIDPLVTRKAHDTDELSTTLDYATVKETIETIASSKPRQLIESLAEEIAIQLLLHPLVSGLTVKVSKFPFPNVAEVSFILKRKKN
ncbi:dihydroneopterin aldolase [Methylacidiphilum sp. Yel]|jgi:FolB domain-containing protein|uniref:YpsA SLOG family protein n=1 Tax=Methylacidiphilum sp. Yel TaxID=1847730 RepID=UPI00106B3B27|nr:putative molybdenum carrier protein [Methylacidiphilum sp. Yel]TFE68989.1 dihydroneopterin aldolase [Methylacidiphilum sp. Yel]